MMHRLVIVLLGLALLHQGAEAQRKMVAGVRGGLSSATLDGVSLERAAFRNGFHAGFFFGIAPVDWLMVQPEIIYDQRGTDGQSSTDGGRIDLDAGYLTIPLAVKFRIPIIDRIFPFATFGPYMSAALSGSDDLHWSGPVGTGSDLAATRIERWDAGGFIGGGVDVQLKRFFITADVRWVLGMNDLAEARSVDLRNAQVLAGAGLGIRF